MKKRHAGAEDEIPENDIVETVGTEREYQRE